MNNNITDAKISIILKIFKLDAMFPSLLNFNENKGIFTTKSSGRIRVLNRIAKPTCCW